MICLCGGYSPIKLGKQTLMDDNECEHYLTNRVAINIDDSFYSDALQTAAASIFVRENECEDVHLSVIG